MNGCSRIHLLLVSVGFVFAGAAAPALAAADTLVMAIQGTPAAVDGRLSPPKAR
jgi:hypothetical protein